MIDGITSVNSIKSSPKELKKAMLEYQVLTGKVEQSEETGVIDTGSKSSTDYQKELDLKKGQLDIINNKIDKIKEQIEAYQAKAQEYIKDGMKAQEGIAEQYDADADNAVKRALKYYTDENSKNPGSVSRDGLSAKIKEFLPQSKYSAKFHEATSNFIKANESLDMLDSCLQTMHFWIGDAKLLETDIANTQIKLDNAKKREAEEAAKKSCDPIGFGKKLDNGDIVTYDFIVDDGSFDETTDFLGATNSDKNAEGWAAMENIDKQGDGNGTITAEEMKSASIKLVKTVKSADGTVKRELLDPDAEEFTSKGGLTVQLNSYSENNLSHDLISNTDSDRDGVLDTALRGTFTAKIGDESWAGYRTDDDIDYLNDTFFKNNDLQAKNADGENFFSQSITDNQNFFIQHTAESQALRAELYSGKMETVLGMSTIESIKNTTKSTANVEAEKINEKIEAEAKAEEEDLIKKLEEKEAKDDASREEMRTALAPIAGLAGASATDIKDWSVEQMRNFVANVPVDCQDKFSDFAKTYGIEFVEKAKDTSTAKDVSATDETKDTSTSKKADNDGAANITITIGTSANKSVGKQSISEYEKNEDLILYKEEPNSKGDAVSILNNKHNSKTYEAINLYNTDYGKTLLGKLLNKIDGFATNDNKNVADADKFVNNGNGTFVTKTNGQNGKPEYLKLIQERDRNGNLSYVIAHSYANDKGELVTTYTKVDLS